MVIEKYSNNEKVIFLWFVLPYALSISMIAFGNCFLNSWKTFLPTIFISIVYFTFVYFIFGLLANAYRKRYPEESKTFKRIGIMLMTFYLLNILLTQGLFIVFENSPFLTCTPQQNMLWWVVAFSVLASTVLTIVNEAAAGWDKWNSSISETEKLKNEYQKTRLLGLKGQVNPHFLFNCFNSLSSLISEDERAADRFLNEMSRVHRYMLRSEDEQMVTIEDEMDFSRSYLYLIEKRFGESIQVDLDVSTTNQPFFLPPLSMQAILENIIYNNVGSKLSPLHIRINIAGFYLEITHSVHPKTRSGKADEEEGLDNLIKKYQLLNVPKIIIVESKSERIIKLPLIRNKEEIL